MTPQEFIDKCDWEGGILEGIFGYGLRSKHLDIQEGEFYDAVVRLESMREEIEEQIEIIMSYDEN